MKNYNEVFENKNEVAEQLQQQKSQRIINETNNNKKVLSKCESKNSNNHYFRITGYCPEHNFCFIIDCNGMFEKLWQFSAYLISKGLKILEVSTAEKFTDINIEKVEQNNEHLILRSTADGKPEYITQTLNGVQHKAIKVADEIYIPNKDGIL